ncbi:Serine protease, subtilisin family [Glycomyces sambucus]|uniref:Serine protease, subtilisin family n=1 Tax=Glycomyces sambucus TaxID=380244 RepID=A0A1G9JT05_9ACTN|nr:S8 family serine peptidase [Glycomyces sambucus]SDL40416.1 Serine protease, subtilisin family [Glycomyces sambucus]
MAIPLTPPPAEPRSPRRPLRTAIGAGLTALAAAGAVATAPGVALAQDTTFYDENTWVTDLIEAPAAWETSTGAGITVAVMDTGVADHPAFEGKDVQPGYSIFEGEADGRADADGHGTAVAAGILLAAPDATILPVRLGTGATDFGGAMGAAEYDAFRWAVDNGADVLVVPWGLIGNMSDEDLEVMQYVIDKGAVIVAGAGNDPSEDVAFPASAPGVVGVTGTDDTGEVWYESTTVGPEVDVAAPAFTMTVPNPASGSLGQDELYREIGGGTSMGSGITGGVLALIWAAHVDLDANNVIQRLIQTAGDGSGTVEEDSGYGLINADEAVNAEGIEPVDENPLGYPMGEAGASGASPDDPASDAEGAEGSGPEAATGGPSVSAEGNKESNLSGIIVVAAAVVLLGAGIAVWLVLRGRGRKEAAQAQQPGFNSGGEPPQGYQQAPPNPTYVPPGGQGYGGPPPGQQGYSSPPQGYNQPGGPAEPSPWRPSDPNQR